MTVEIDNIYHSSSPTTSTSAQNLTSVSSSSRNSASDELVPSVPSPGVVLYKSEEQSDFSFSVSPDPNRANGWRFPAHSFIVGNASPVFKRIVDDCQSSTSLSDASPPKVFVTSNPKIFDLLMSFVYKHETSINSVATCLELYSLSNQFEMYDLSHKCLTFLYNYVSLYNVLEILCYLRNENKTQRFDASVPNENILNELINKCLNILDENADHILRSEEFENIDQSMLVELLSRETLRLFSESTAFDAITRWSNQQCLKRGLELIGVNKRSVLGDALYCVKYLVMSSDEFLGGPFLSDLLTEEEKKSLLNKIKGMDVELPSHLNCKPLNMKRRSPKPSVVVSPHRRLDFENGSLSSTNGNSTPIENATDLQCNGELVGKKNKNSISKRIARGMSDFLICAIQLLD